MHFARKAAWLCGGAMALVPQISTGNASHTRLTIGATVVSPCLVGTQTNAPICAGHDSSSLVTKDAIKLDPPSTSANTGGNFAKFVEVSF